MPDNLGRLQELAQHAQTVPYRSGHPFVYSALVLEECASLSFTLASFSSLPSDITNLMRKRSYDWPFDLAEKGPALLSKSGSNNDIKMFSDASLSIFLAFMVNV
jgi:hypothetical protein